MGECPPGTENPFVVANRTCTDTIPLTETLVFPCVNFVTVVNDRWLNFTANPVKQAGTPIIAYALCNSTDGSAGPAWSECWSGSSCFLQTLVSDALIMRVLRDHLCGCVYVWMPRCNCCSGQRTMENINVTAFAIVDGVQRQYVPLIACVSAD